jgi:hypothetical protein
MVRSGRSLCHGEQRFDDWDDWFAVFKDDGPIVRE